MKTSVIELSKIIFCPTSKKYQIFFKSSNINQYFVMYLSNKYAKNIAMASENIASTSLSQYELFINLLKQLNITICKVYITKHENTLTSFIYFNDNNKKFKINSNITDSIILSMKTFIDVCIDSSLLLDKNNNDSINSQEDISTLKSLTNEIQNRHIDDNSDVKILKLALEKCIQDEKFESAAFLRDRIKFIKRN
tara:strand:- start:3360 stop:3944 length:585 start_codon:yes stop_codon:yes gene_type:complete